MPPDQQRARDVATDVARIMLAKGNLAEMVRKHIEGLGLTLPRLYRLNMFSRNNAVSGHKLVGQEGVTQGEWRVASRLVHRPNADSFTSDFRSRSAIGRVPDRLRRRLRAYGKAVIETVRDKGPIAYMRIAAALLPTKVEIAETLDGLTNEHLDAYMEEMNNGLLERAAKGDPDAIERSRKLGLLSTV
jgi:hypothetical protein